ncbi:hypothetical protein C0J52_27187 [Blattella germanica]|nr:hypothetical protein C0J52_27187 [Blattella germanica]
MLPPVLYGPQPPPPPALAAPLLAEPSGGSLLYTEETIGQVLYELFDGRSHTELCYQPPYLSIGKNQSFASGMVLILMASGQTLIQLEPLGYGNNESKVLRHMIIRLRVTGTPFFVTCKRSTYDIAYRERGNANVTVHEDFSPLDLEERPALP